MRTALTFFLSCLFALTLDAQSEPLFSHFMFNRLNYNPAYAGAKDLLDAAAIYRNQWWSGIDGAPRTLNLFAHAPFAQRRNGAGISLLYDKIGLHKTLSLGLSYAYRIPLDAERRNTLALGLGGRFENLRTDWDLADPLNTDDEQLGLDGSNSTFNVGAGVFFTNPNFYLGLSVPRLLKNSLYTQGNGFGASVNTYYFQGGLILPMNGQVKFYPNLLVSLNPRVPFELDLNANFLFFDALWLGLSHRLGDSLVGLVQFEFDNGLRLGLAVDLTTSDLREATTGSYELLVGYTFPCEDCLVKSLRYF